MPAPGTASVYLASSVDRLGAIEEPIVPIVTIQQFPRHLEQKRELARRITEAFAEVYGMKEDAVQVFFREVDGENWAKGGVMGCDRNAGAR